MRQYKLIKEYPNSYPLNTIWYKPLQTSNFWYPIDGNLCDGRQVEETFIKYPELWEEVKEKEYEIISYIENNSNRVFSKEFVKPMKKKYPQYASIKMIYACMDGGWIASEEYIVNNLKIHSVKRLSDGEVFTIGDKCHLSCGNGYRNPIVEFNIGKEGCFKDKMTFTLKTICDENWGPMELSILVHSKKSLFTTEDGVDIFEGDEVFTVETNAYYSLVSETVPIMHSYAGELYFSSKEKAEEYIIKNKPCLSYNEIVSFTGNSFRTFHEFHSTLKDFAKSKLNIK